MCNSTSCSHNDLNDSIDDLFGGAPADLGAADTFARVALSRATHDPARPATFEETCPACKGSGRFRSYTGRIVGECFKCKGKGKLVFKTSTETRAKATEARATKADQARIELQDRKAAWVRDNAEAFAWMREKEESFDFAASMLEAFNRYGRLTDNQLAAVLRCMARDAERAEARKRDAAERAANAPAVDVSVIEKAFASAQANGIKRPRMMLDGIKFSLAPAHGRNAGALYVVRRSDDQYLGKIMDGRFTRARDCTAEQEAEIVRIASNPHAEAVAYGQRTGVCCICSRELTNHASIDAGIGPICATKYGWA